MRGVSFPFSRFSGRRRERSCSRITTGTRPDACSRTRSPSRTSAWTSPATSWPGEGSLAALVRPRCRVKYVGGIVHKQMQTSHFLAWIYTSGLRVCLCPRLRLLLRYSRFSPDLTHHCCRRCRCTKRPALDAPPQLLRGRNSGRDGPAAGGQRRAAPAGGVQLRRQVAGAGGPAGPSLRQKVRTPLARVLCGDVRCRIWLLSLRRELHALTAACFTAGPDLSTRLVCLGCSRKDKSFVAGGTAGKLLLNKKGWLGHDEIVLHKGEGPVSAIAWRCGCVGLPCLSFWPRWRWRWQTSPASLEQTTLIGRSTGACSCLEYVS